MQVNFVSIIFLLAAIITGVIGLLLNYAERYLPNSIVRSYRYGKFSANVYEPIVAKLEVPKRWFKHFYVFGAPASTYVLYLVICKYFWNINVPKYIIWVLDICLGSQRLPLVSAENTFVAALLFNLHCCKRFYESHYVNVFSDKMMNISHYMIGLYHYIGTLMSIIGESEGFVKDSNTNFSFGKITYFQIICGIIFISSSYAQLKANLVLRNLRKEKDDKINHKAYKIPHGGLFKYVSGALQITEIIIYVIMSTILRQSRTFHCVTIWVLVNQICTAVLTHKWYIQTFQNYPKSRKILIPHLF